MNPYNAPAELRETGVIFSEDEQGFQLCVAADAREERYHLVRGEFTISLVCIFRELVSRGRVSLAVNRY
jgi:hypothetical protein